MVKLLSHRDIPDENRAIDLLYPEEVIAIVDDAPEIALILSNLIDKLGLPAQRVTHAGDFYLLLKNHKVALVLLDIELPGESGINILKKIVPKYPDLGIIMVTGSTDLNIALECLRNGADDYLTKPVNPGLFDYTVIQTLKKRKLAIENRLFQEELLLTNSRTNFLHQLNLKMNNAYLGTVELKAVLHAVLVGITSQEGLQFNRAFLLLLDDTFLRGKLAIGPARREDANNLWKEINSKNIRLQNIIQDIIDGKLKPDTAINNIIRQVKIPLTNNNHVLIQASSRRESIHVVNGHSEEIEIPDDLIALLENDTFIITPLYSPGNALGLIIADNFVTNKPITREDMNSLEILGSQASLAIEQSRLYQEMQLKLDELELTTKELEKSKDLLLEAERLSTLGHMSAQLVHAIRNPVTALGGTARLLKKRINNPEAAKFAEIIVNEAARVEASLEDLFHYVEEGTLDLSEYNLKKLIRKSLTVFYTSMQRLHISSNIIVHNEDFTLKADIRKMRQVFHHLIKNSIEATEREGVISITSSLQNNILEIVFSDTGRGIKQGNISKATDAFFTTKTYGTGMGLTLVEQILQQHKGDFELRENTGNRGTSAIIRLPQ